MAFAWVSLLKKVQTFDEMESTHRATINCQKSGSDPCELVLLAQPNSGLPTKQLPQVQPSTQYSQDIMWRLL
ncbi:MAG: hypothetical protein QGH53_04015, partial [Prochlorococcaceae cyanobacterium ETNP18_MAG_1]|nr:hypothetical protein [Prochlorococcaceae cyanobacterium ETNP18_MAG_1]